jgi:hypothetical protein
MTTKYLFKSNPIKPEADIFLPEKSHITIEFIDGNVKDYSAKADQLKYTNIWNDTDLVYDFTLEEIKETIVLNSPKSPKQFKFKITGFSHYNIQNGMIFFFNASHELLYYIKKPYLILSDGATIEDHNLIQHSFNKETNVYSLRISDFEENLYPIIIDPTFAFDNPNKYIGSEANSAVNNNQIFITGSTENFDVIPYSNTIADEETPKLLGSDIVTFHRNVNTYLEFMDGSDSLQDISSVKVFGKEKITTIIDSNSQEITLYANLSPVLLFAKINDSDNPTYDFKVMFSDSIKQASDVTISADLTSTIDGISLTDNSFGIIDQQPSVSPSKSTEYLIVYRPPSSIPDDSDSVLLRVKIEVSFTFGSKTTTITKYLYAFIQLTTFISLEPFEFKYNTIKRDL